YINKDDGENLAEITGAVDGETAACPLPYGDHPSGNEQHPTSRSEVKRRRSAGEAETPSSGDGGQGHFQLVKTPRTARTTSEALATNDKKGSGTKEGQGSSYGEHHILRQTHLVIKNEGQVTLAELQSKVPPPATAAKVTPSMMVSNSMRPNTGPQPSQPAAERQTSDAPESQERKRSISMCFQREGDVGLTAWQSPIPAGCSRRRAKRSENAVEADIGHAQAVTCWNSRLNDWVIDLTAEDQSEYGLAIERLWKEGLVRGESRREDYVAGTYDGNTQHDDYDTLSRTMVSQGGESKQEQFEGVLRGMMSVPCGPG
ncbi:hypothetical protein GN958_ATG00936, partial [Phytophthora infestans]